MNTVKSSLFTVQAGKNGTTVIATNLFSNIPVRKQFYKDQSRRKEELKKIERYIAAFSIISPTVRKYRNAI